MKSVRKIFGLLLLGLLLLVVAAGFFITQFFDPNDYKDDIRQLAREKANVELELNGDIGWSLFPWLGLELTDVKVASADTPNDTLASVRLVGLSVRVMPLLRKEVQMNDIRVEGLNLSLHRDAKGKANWEGIGEKTTATAGEKPASSNDNETAEKTSALKLDIDSVIVNSAGITYKDDMTGDQFTLESVQLTTESIREDKNIPIKLSGFFGSTKPRITANFELTGEALFNLEKQLYELNDLKLSSEISGEPFNGKAVAISARGTLQADLEKQTASWKGIRLTANQLKLMGDLALTELNNTPKVDGAVSIAAFNLGTFLTGLGQELPVMANKNSLSDFSLQAQLKGSAENLKIQQLQVKLDQTQLTGELAANNLSKTPLMVVKLKGDKINIDDYLPPVAADNANASRKAEIEQMLKQAGSAGTTPTPAPANAYQWDKTPVLPLASLRGINLDADLQFEEIIVNKLPLNKISLKAKANSGLISLNQLQASLFSGSISSTATIDARTNTPTLKVAPSVKNMPIDRLLKALDQPAVITGQFNFNADLSMIGNSQQAWVNTLSGNSNFNLANGSLQNVNVDGILCEAIALINGKPMANKPSGKNTAFTQLSGNIRFNKGVANNPDLRISIPGLSVKGNGSVDLASLGIDYKVGLIIEGDQRAMPDPACQINKNFVGIEWPVRCRGPLELGAKACRIDQAELGKTARQLAGKKFEEKLDDQLKGKVDPKLQDALKGLFNR